MFRYLLLLSQKKLELFWFRIPEVPAKRMLPGVMVERVKFPVTTAVAMVLVARVEVALTVKVPVMF